MNNRLYGVLYGDIAGSTYEFRSVTNYNFTTVPPNSRFTDDTVMTCAVASWLMRDPTNTNILVEEMQRLGNLYAKAGYGGMFRKWLKAKNPEPYNSFGNGSAMRVAPCAWVAKSLVEAEKLAEVSASVTHNHPEGIKGAQAVAAAIFMARMGKSKEDIQEYIETKYGYDLNRTVDDIVEDDYSFDSTCQGSVPEAIIAFLDGENYEDVIRKAIYLGGDADTQAAIAGSIAEAFYGTPNHVSHYVHKYVDNPLLEIINKFNEFCNE